MLSLSLSLSLFFIIPCKLRACLASLGTDRTNQNLMVFTLKKGVACFILFWVFCMSKLACEQALRGSTTSKGKAVRDDKPYACAIDWLALRLVLHYSFCL